ncbi:MAG: nitronate monooxygenase [Nitrospinae bacterium]|nr:nitronate monooxygenase [Nitrospinota bacterium]
MRLNELKIGGLTIKVPIFQGGMSVKVSTAPLVAAVANEGGVGLIGGTGISVAELEDQIRRTRELTNGIFGVNVMVAIDNFLDIVKACVREKVHMIAVGAGFSREIFKLCHNTGVEVVPIVSSAKAAKMSEKLGANAVIVEGGDAGGHLGTNIPVWDLIPETRAAVKIPVIAAGGLVDGGDIAEMISLGADGVQLGNRFVLSDECDVHPNFKKVFLEAREEDMTTIRSPVGYLGSAVKTPFVEKFLKNEFVKITQCTNCLKVCSRSFCILERLKMARDGDIENGLFFAGRNVYKIKDILPVKEIFRRLVEETNEKLAALESTGELPSHKPHEKPDLASSEKIPSQFRKLRKNSPRSQDKTPLPKETPVA